MRDKGGPLGVLPISAALGLLPLFLDVLLADGQPSLRTATAFAVLGGGVGVTAAAAASLLRGADASWTVGAASAWVIALLETLYLIHVVVLDEEGLLHPRSLAWSAVILAVAAALLLSSRWLRAWAAWRALGWTVAPLLVGAAILEWAPLWPENPRTPRPAGSGPNVVLVAMDAVRRDHAAPHADRGLTPNLAGLATSARVYDHAFAGSSWTRVSVPIMLGSRRRGSTSSAGLAGRLRQAGYVSACFSDNPILDGGSELTREFHFVGSTTSKPLVFLQRLFENTFVGTFVLRWPLLARLWSDRKLVDAAIDWAGEVRGPFFLYVHLMNAHMPYDEGAIDGRSWRFRRLTSPQSSMRMRSEEAEDVRAFYAGGVRSLDAEMGRLVRAVKALRRPYLIVITADHGESLGEGGRWGHASGLWPELVQVPLLVLGEGVHQGRVTAPVGHLSILPTFLAAAGLVCECSGTDLRTSDGDPVVEGEYPPDESYRVADGYRVVVDQHAGVVRLFDLRNDPLETKDLAAALPQVAGRLSAGLVGRQSDPHISPGDLERFRALGYVQ
jgi:hypothetical protein